jgi:hypothetical protein
MIMKNKPTLLDAWKASWKFHLAFYPIYTWIVLDMLPQLFDPANENPLLVKVLATTGVVVMGVVGLGRFAYLWYKNNK